MVKAKYSVTVRPPKAKRMAKHGKIVVQFGGGWDGWLDKKFYPIPEGAAYFEFEMNEEFKWKYNTSEMDGLIFEVLVVYENESKSRKESYSLVPERILEQNAA